MIKISFEIRKIENGFVVEDSYFGNEIFIKDFIKAKDKVNKTLNEFEKEEMEE